MVWLVGWFACHQTDITFFDSTPLRNFCLRKQFFFDHFQTTQCFIFSVGIILQFKYRWWYVQLHIQGLYLLQYVCIAIR